MTSTEVLKAVMLENLIVSPHSDHSDVDVALALMDLVRDDLTASGTGGGQRLREPEIRLAIRALERTTARLAVPIKLAFRDHEGWRAYWVRNGAHGSWQARRELLSDLFDEPYKTLMAMQEEHLDSTLLTAVSPREQLGWNAVDTEIGELRRHFRTAQTPQDYRAVGNDAVHVMEALSRQIYEHAVHGQKGEDEPPVDKTKLRMDRYIEARLAGKANAEMRRYARSAIELAQAVKHSGAPTRTKAGILADAVIALANMLRRLAEESEADDQNVMRP